MWSHLVQKWHYYHFHLHVHIAPIMLLLAFGLGTAYAGQITNANAVLSDPRPGENNVNYKLNFTVPSSTVLRSFEAKVCTTAPGCSTPAGFSAAGAVLAAQPSGYGDTTGWIDDSNSGAFRFKKSTNVAAPGGLQSVAFDNALNPSANGSYMMYLTTYSDDAYTTPVDTATIMFVIVSGVTINVTVDPSLSFSVTGVPPSTVYKGSLATSDRCVNAPTSINFGTSSMELAPDTDYDCAQTLTTSTNGSGGYQVTVTGVVPGDDLVNAANSTIAVEDWTGTNPTPSPTPSGVAELFGYTTADPTLSGVADRFTQADNLFAGLRAIPDEVAYSATTADNDAVNVGWRLRFTFFSSPGTYEGKVVYTCTSVF